MKLRLQNYIILLLLVLSSGSLSAQAKYTWRDTFTQSATYCPGDHQVDRWISWRKAIDTSTVKYNKLSINGQYASSAITCADKYAVRRIMTALKKQVAYTEFCNSYYWQTDNPGSCTGGCMSTKSSDALVLAVATTTGLTCSCPNPGNIIRAGIGNSNWGGINTATCGGTTQWMELVAEFDNYKYDVGVVDFGTLNQCSKQQNITATIRNVGKNQIDSFNWGYSINTTTYGPYKAKFKFASTKDSVFKLQTPYTFTNNTLYKFKVWVSKPNNQTDSGKANDTLYYTLDFKGQTIVPDLRDTTVCGSQKVTLKATTFNVNDSVIWYADRNGKTTLGTGKSYTTKFLSSKVPNAKYKFYAATYNGFVKGRQDMGYSYVYYWYGNMFDIKPKRDITIDSVHMNIYSALYSVGSTFDVEIYVAEGQSYSGIATTSSAWTQVYKGTGISRGSQTGSPVPFKYSMKANTTYAVYYFIPNQGILFDQTGGRVINGTDMDITIGNGTGGLFSNIGSGYDVDGSIFYKYPLCPSVVDSSVVTVNPLPIGATMAPSTPFTIAPLNGGAGTVAKPWVVAYGDTISFELTPPTSLAYSNSTHGSNWKVTTQSVKTTLGVDLASGANWQWSNPTTSKNGKFWFTPSLSQVDNTYEVIVKFQDIGTTNCDSFVKTRIYVAPLPEPDFTRQAKICDGDGIIFNNKSKIQSGFLNYKWDFGNGDTSEAASPVYFYPNYGTYVTTLKAISGLYGYVRVKKDTITVTQIPKVAFDVLNVCEKQTTKFTNATTISSGVLAYEWDFGDLTAKSTVKDPTHKYSAAKKYIVTLKATANGCSASKSKNAYVFPKPVAKFTYPSGNGIKYCTGAEVPFTNQSTLASGNLGAKWTFADGELGTVLNPSHAYDNGGNYNVQLIAVSEFGCADTVKKSVNILPSPKANFGVDATCNLTPSVFTSTGIAVTPAGESSNWSWNFGDGGTSSAENPTYQFTKVGPTQVKFVMSLTNGCKDSITKTLNVGSQANVDFSGQDVCSGQPLPFENKTTWTQGNITYKWYFGDTDSTDVADPVKTYNTPTTRTYVVSLSAKVDGGCVSSKSKNITVYQLPIPDFTISDDWTPGDGFRTIKVTAANSSYPFYRYKISDGGSLNTSTGKYQFSYDGSYTITLCVRNEANCEACSTQTKNIFNGLNTKDVLNGKINVFPNPTTGIINIKTLDGVTLNKVEIVNTVGQVVASKAVNENLTSVNIADQTQGVYLVRMYTSNGIMIQKINLIR